MRGLWTLPLVLASVAAAVPSPTAAVELTRAKRVEAQRRIETVYWQHRIWPAENPRPKPPLSEVLPEAALQRKVDDILLKSNLLSARWKSPITSEQLQAELVRIERDSRESSVLHEIFDALGDDPRLIAETLARRTLSDRFVQTLYARDEEIHGKTRRKAESALAACAGRGFECLARNGADVHEVHWVLAGPDDSGKAPLMEPDDRGEVTLSRVEWDRLVTKMSSLTRGVRNGTRISTAAGSALESGSRTALLDKDDRFEAVEIRGTTDSRIDAVVAVWAKKRFDEWWSLHRKDLSTEIEEPEGRYFMGAPDVGTALAASDCERWRATSMGQPPEDRDNHTAIWTGSEMIIWGGSTFNTGGRYDPATDTWRPTSLGANVPSIRYAHTAVWTGTEMIVWGGENGGPPLQGLSTGGRYNPVSDTWLPTSTGTNAPAGRWNHTAVWTGQEMIVWGGEDESGSPVNTGGRYRPATDSWTSTSIGPNVPAARTLSRAVWTGSVMIVWGGSHPDTNTGGLYDPGSDTWTPTSTGPNTPSARTWHVAVWAGNVMVVWGGASGEVDLNTGGRYSPTTNTWLPTSVGPEVPTPRSGATAVWTGNEMIVWGGTDIQVNYPTVGGRYDPNSDTWTATPTDAYTPMGRFGHTAVWTGTEMLIWGGFSNPGGRFRVSTNSWFPISSEPEPELRGRNTAVWTGAEIIVWGGQKFDGPTFNTGGLYDPATSSWQATSTGANVPSARRYHTAVWTGLEMIVWGGYTGTSYPVAGGRFSPATNSWTTMSVADVPPRQEHTAVWTGSQMIVWGGNQGIPGPVLDTGSRYTPSSDTWAATSTTGVPTARYGHTSIWDGAEMIVWGGTSASVFLNTGGRYNPVSNTWSATSTGANVPGLRRYHTAVWTGSEMIVWGGQPETNTGGRYSPATNTWSASSTSGDLPSARAFHTAVWTGSEMIVWGGRSGTTSLNTGGRYRLATDTWSATSSESVPAARYQHTAVWAGSEMIVWGGNANPGGRYHLSNDGTPCDDANACTTNDVCLGNVCSGQPLDCGSGDLCAGVTCDPATGCVTTPVSCDDNNACTGDSCDTTLGCQHVDIRPGLVTGLVALNPVDFAWNNQGADRTYDVVRGSVGQWPVGNGPSEICVAGGLTSSNVTDAAYPAAGAVFFYLVRAVRDTCEGSYGTASNGIRRISFACP